MYRIRSSTANPVRHVRRRRARLAAHKPWHRLPWQRLPVPPPANPANGGHDTALNQVEPQHTAPSHTPKEPS